MSNQVISLTSSDEEDDAEPPLKKRKITPRSSPILPECTLTLVTTKSTESASKTIETVSLDSDDDIAEDKNDTVKKTPDSVNSDEKTAEKSVNCTDNVDLISLTDDEEDEIQPKVNKVNGINNSALKSKTAAENVPEPEETVSIIDDSDTEVEPNKDEGCINKEKTIIIEKNNHSIIIDDSDEETEKENHCENEPNKTFPVHIGKTCAKDVAFASTSKLTKKRLEHKSNVTINEREASRNVGNDLGGRQDELEESKNLFKKFIRMIEEKIVDSTFEEILPKKVPIINKYFNRSGLHVKDKAFQSLLMDSIGSIRKSTTANGANSAVLAFHKVFEHLKSHVTETTIMVEEDNLPKIKKLEHTIKLLRKRIQQLETAEVNFDDDEDSAYIMLDRYQARLKKVYAKYCQYINRNPFSGRATYDRITFVNSSYNEINQALTRKYKNSLVFPSYYELENYITKVSKKEKLNLSDSDIRIESRKCFKVLGSILQKKRRQELYDSHLDFVESSEDPATKDISLENILKKNYAEGKEKIEKLYQKYVTKQERGEDHVSTDEERSSEDSGDENNKHKKGKAKKANGSMVNTKTKGEKINKEGRKNKNLITNEHNNNESNVKEDQKKKEIYNELLNEIEGESHPKDIQKLDENHKIKQAVPKEPKNQQEYQEEKVEDTKNTTEKTSSQEEFLSVLNMQKQNKDDPIDK